MHAPSPSFCRTDVLLNRSEARSTATSPSIIVLTEGDGAASDSFVNNAGYRATKARERGIVMST